MINEFEESVGVVSLCTASIVPRPDGGRALPPSGSCSESSLENLLSFHFGFSPENSIAGGTQ